MAAETDAKVRRRQRPHPLPASTIREPEEPHAILVRYADGLQATVLKIGKDSNRWNFACRLKGETRPRATMFYNGPWGNRCLFKALSHGLQQFFIHQDEPYPVERTLLTGAAIDAAMHSHQQSGKPISTPQLKVRYAAKDFTAFRENGESWKLLTADQVEHMTFTPGDRDSKAK